MILGHLGRLRFRLVDREGFIHLFNLIGRGGVVGRGSFVGRGCFVGNWSVLGLARVADVSNISAVGVSNLVGHGLGPAVGQHYGVRAASGVTISVLTSLDNNIILIIKRLSNCISFICFVGLLSDY